MDKKVNIIIVQKRFLSNINKNILDLEKLITNEKIIANSILVLHELSLSKYFCISKNKRNFTYAINEKSLVINKIKNICINNKIFLLFSYFEKENGKYYNSTSLISPKGIIIGKYRKKNLPNELCYHESFYFNTHREPFKVFDIGLCKIGLMLCWDQWYSHSYAELSKLGADIILCPTSIGHTYNNNKKITLANEKEMWEKIIQANSLMNNIPVIISNRFGRESSGRRAISFWGSSFITDADGKIIAKASNNQTLIRKTIDLSNRKKSIQKWQF